MSDIDGRGWNRPGGRSSDYTKTKFHNHDRRNYSSIENFTGKGPRNYKRSSKRILEDACEALYWNPDVDASRVEVKVEEHTVFLDGYVDSKHAKKEAEKVVERISGVRDVYNRLRVGPCLDVNSDKIVTRGDEGLFTQETLQR